MGLSAKERETLDALNKKAKEPDAPAGSLSYNLDLSDDKAYDRAVKLGLISGPDDDGDDDSDDDDDDKPGDEIPRRRGSLADRMMGGN